MGFQDYPQNNQFSKSYEAKGEMKEVQADNPNYWQND